MINMTEILNIKAKRNRMKKLIILPIAMLALFGCTDTPKDTGDEEKSNEKNVKVEPESARPAHWGYLENDGPSTWATLSSKYMLCGGGSHQSPIDIIDLDSASEVSFEINYESTTVHISHNENMDDIIDNGHTIQLDIDNGSSFTLKGETYHLKQFHFHTPSEHTLNGKHYPMEMHFVHQADDGRLAVIGVFVEEGEVANENIQLVIDNLPESKGEMIHLEDLNIALNVVIPPTEETYHYSGSLTTPPCSEDVEWLVLKNPISTIKEHITSIHNKISKNNRPTQNLNDRGVSKVIDQIDE